jgi:hypothetical protein
MFCSDSENLLFIRDKLKYPKHITNQDFFNIKKIIICYALVLIIIGVSALKTIVS